MVNEHLDLLGRRAEDKVTGFKGTVSSVCFDLYGCIQAAVTPPKKEDGTLGDQYWIDVSRLMVEHGDPVMTRPNYVSGPIAEGKHGPAEKPSKSA